MVFKGFFSQNVDKLIESKNIDKLKIYFFNNSNEFELREKVGFHLKNFGYMPKSPEEKLYFNVFDSQYNAIERNDDSYKNIKVLLESKNIPDTIKLDLFNVILEIKTQDADTYKQQLLDPDYISYIISNPYEEITFDDKKFLNFNEYILKSILSYFGVIDEEKKQNYIMLIYKLKKAISFYNSSYLRFEITSTYIKAILPLSGYTVKGFPPISYLSFNMIFPLDKYDELSFGKGAQGDPMSYYFKDCEVKPPNIIVYTLGDSPEDISLKLTFNAAILNSQRNCNKAIELCNNAIELNSKNPYAWYNKAHALFLLKQSNEAEECLKKASDIDSEYNNVKKYPYAPIGTVRLKLINKKGSNVIIYKKENY